MLNMYTYIIIDLLIPELPIILCSWNIWQRREKPNNNNTKYYMYYLKGDTY